jgi:predicted nucleotidyltransferase
LYPNENNQEKNIGKEPHMDLLSPTRVCGVICEYNPFHKGHAYQLQKARELSGAQVMVCVMSGPFTQRGDAAVLSPGLRAEMALHSGADVVVELPAAYAVREAEFFALGGVSLLQALNADNISFGCEDEDLKGLQQAALLLEQPTEAFSEALRSGLKRGQSHAKAQGSALQDCLNQEQAGIVSAPNNVLAICYLRALYRINSAMKPVLVKRLGNYHDTLGQEGFASATAVREAIRRGDWHQIGSMIPEEALPPLFRAMENGAIHRADALDILLREKLRHLDKDSLLLYPNVSEGLEHRLMRLAPMHVSRQGLLAALKTKRYTHARLSRLLTHILLGMTKDYLSKCQPQSYRLLGFRPQARAYLNYLPKGLLYTKAARQEKDASFLLDMAAYDLWSMGAGLPLGEGFRQHVSIT